jgi:hypothetical protein
VAGKGQVKNAYNVLMVKAEEEMSQTKSWVDGYVKVYPSERVCNFRRFIGLFQERDQWSGVVNMIMAIRRP